MIDLHSIPLDDAKTYRMLSKGYNVGVFQLEAGWIKGVLKDVKPETFDDIVAILALIRPGSMDNGGVRLYAERKRRAARALPEWRIHSDLARLDDILAPTYGIIIYQETVLAILKEVCSWDYGQADLVFNALRKKNVEKLAAARPEFNAAGLANGVSQEGLDALWQVLEPFADYSFNLAHATAYAYTTYWTAYLKANYPTEFIASLMTHEAESDKIRMYIREARELSIKVLPPDINDSDRGFTPTSAGIRYGLEAIRDVGANAVEGILDQRPFRDIDDFFWRVDTKVLSIRVLGALSEAGSLDQLWSSREGFMAEAERIARLATRHRRAADNGERPLFRFRLTPWDTHSEPDWGARGSLEAARLGVQLTYPRIVLRVPRHLSTSEAAWLNTVLTGREPVSEVIMESGGYRVPLGVKSSVKGLASAVKTIGVEVTLE